MQSIESVQFVFLVLALSLWSAWCLHTGLCGLIKKRPLIRSARGLLAIFILINLAIAAFGNNHALFRFGHALVALGAIVQAINPAYSAVGVTGSSLNTAVYAALAKLGLEFEVKGGVIHIPNEQLNIWVSSPFLGRATVSTTQRSGRPRLRQIVAHVAASFKAGDAEVDYTMFVLNVVFGLALMGFVVVMASAQ